MKLTWKNSKWINMNRWRLNRKRHWGRAWFRAKSLIQAFLLKLSILRVSVCSPPFVPKNGGYTCHPVPCQRLADGTVVEYFCDEGYTLKGDYKYVTCQNGEWNSPMQISCVFSQGEFSLQTCATPGQCCPLLTSPRWAIFTLIPNEC